MDKTGRTLQRLPLIGLFGCAVAAALLQCGDPVEPVPEVGAFEVRVPSLTASYNRSARVVRLEWQAPTGEYDFYRVYRSDAIADGSVPDTSELKSIHSQSRISRESQTYDDHPGVGDGIYYYAIKAVRVVNGREIEGRWSPAGPDGEVSLVACRVGVGVSFNINGGDEYTLLPKCTLSVYDPWHELASVRFTHFDTTGAGGGIGTFDPADIDSQVYHLSATAFFDGDGGATGGLVPDFSVHDPVNKAEPAYNGSLDTNRFEWVLRQGAGLKKVWAEVTYRTGEVDTIYQTIRTEPHKVEIVLRHVASSGLGSERIDTVEGQGEKISVLYAPNVRFSVKIYGDRSIKPEFDAWIVTSTKYEKVTTSAYRPRGWYMTRPRTFGLTGVGDEHRSDYVYAYSLDPSSGEGTENLSRLLKGRNSPSIDTVYRDQSAAANRQLVDELIGSALANYGRKQFVLVLRFTEEYFGGRFIKMYGFEDGVEVFKTYRDLYLPLMDTDGTEANTGYIEDGDTLKEPFDFILDTTSLEDGGFANITEVGLLVARLPEGYVWDPRETPGELTVDSVRRFSNDLIPFHVENRGPVVKHVRWDDIDPTEWTTGHYVMGVVVRDDKGSFGFANVNASTQYVHPLRVFISAKY